MDATERYIISIKQTIELLLERAHNHVDLGDKAVVIECMDIVEKLRNVI